MNLSEKGVLLSHPRRALEKAIRSCEDIDVLTVLWNRAELFKNSIGSMGTAGHLSFEDLSSLQVEVDRQQTILATKETTSVKKEWFRITNKDRQSREDAKKNKKNSEARAGSLNNSDGEGTIWGKITRAIGGGSGTNRKRTRRRGDE